MLTFGGFLLLGRAAWRPVRPAAHLPRRHRDLHDRLARLRPRADTGRPHRRARGAGRWAAPIVSAVAMALIVNLFTEPGERAKAMGIFGFVMAGGGSVGVLLGGVLTAAFDWHWIFLVNLPIGAAVFALCLWLLPASAGLGGRRAARHRRRRDRDGFADARRLRHRERQRDGLDLRRRRSASSVARARAVRAVPRDRSEGAGAADAARAFPPPQPRHGQRRGRALGGRDVRVVFHLGPLPPARARLQPARGGALVPAGQSHHGRVLARPIGEAS